jgi:hypothetical protein
MRTNSYEQLRFDCVINTIIVIAALRMKKTVQNDSRGDVDIAPYEDARRAMFYS